MAFLVFSNTIRQKVTDSVFIRHQIQINRHVQQPCQRWAFGTSSVRCESFFVRSIEDFEKKVKKSDKPVIVDFFATWCNPCKIISPRIESVVGEKKGAITLAKVDIDDHSELAIDYDVDSVPVLMIMKNGKEVNRMLGVQDTDKIRAWVDEGVR